MIGGLVLVHDHEHSVDECMAAGATPGSRSLSRTPVAIADVEVLKAVCLPGATVVEPNGKIFAKKRR